MKLITAIIIAATLATPVTAKTITNDPGGNMVEYLNATRVASATGQRIKIKGWCASACALYLGSPHTCVTKRAKVAFHAPYGGTKAQNKHAAAMYANSLPLGLGSWFMKNAAHLTGKDMAVLSGADLIAMGVARGC